MALTLRRDGGMTRTRFGNARQGTVDRHETAIATVSAFDAIARAVIAEGFFQLADEYRDPRVADAEWTSTTILQGARRKSVLATQGQAPPQLTRIQDLLEQLAGTVSWTAR